MFELFIISALLGLIPAFIARNKGREFVLWWIYGALLFIVALIHSLLMKPDVHALLMKSDPRSAEALQLAQGLKKCPHCAEMIKPDANVCKHCGRDVAQIQPQT